MLSKPLHKWKGIGTVLEDGSLDLLQDVYIREPTGLLQA